METIIDNKTSKQYKVNGSWRISGSCKPYAGYTGQPKNFTLNVKFNNISVYDIILKALEPTRITAVNNRLRKTFDEWENGDTIDIDFVSPGKNVVDTRKAVLDSMQADGVDMDDDKAIAAWLRANK